MINRKITNAEMLQECTNFINSVSKYSIPSQFLIIRHLWYSFNDTLEKEGISIALIEEKANKIVDDEHMGEK